MLDLLNTQNDLHTRAVDFTLKEYMFVLQCVLGERIEVAYANVFDTAEFKRNIPSEDEEEYLAGLKKDAEILLDQQQCKHLKEYLETEYRREVQNKASSLEEFHFTGSDVSRILNNLLHDRTQNLSESSVKDIVSLLRTMYEAGAIESSDSGFQSHFVVIPKKYDILCPACGREGYAVEGLDFVCSECHSVAKWDESQHRYFPNLESL